MGANQSRPSDVAIQEKLIERLQALQTKDEISINEKEGYVCIDNRSGKQVNWRPSSNLTQRCTDSKSTRPVPYSEYKQDVSASTLKDWEKELLEDAKVNHISVIVLGHQNQLHF
jgi:bleomycin hydrolase